MRIEQDKEFKPVTITLETPEEYRAFFLIVRRATDYSRNLHTIGEEVRKMIKTLSDFATNNTI